MLLIYDRVWHGKCEKLQDESTTSDDWCSGRSAMGKKLPYHNRKNDWLTGREMHVRILYIEFMVWVETEVHSTALRNHQQSRYGDFFDILASFRKRVSIGFCVNVNCKKWLWYGAIQNGVYVWTPLHGFRFLICLFSWSGLFIMPANIWIESVFLLV